jgi:hypothetical protein
VAIVPRCYISGSSATLVSFTLPLTGWTNAGAGAAGTAPQPNDYVIIVAQNNTNGGSVAQTAGTPWANLTGPTPQPTAGSFWAVTAGRTWTGYEVAPQWTWTNGSRYAYVAVAFAPDAGNAVFLDTTGTTKVDSTPSTSHTMPAATPTVGVTDTSVLLLNASSGATGTTNITETVPAGWTNIVGQSQTSSGTYVINTWMGYKASATGTQTPAAQTIEGGASSTGTTNAVLNHALLREYPAPAQPDVGGAVDSFAATFGAYLGDTAAGTDAFTGQPTPPYAESAGATEAMAVAVAETLLLAETAGASDGLKVIQIPVPAPLTSAAALPASPAFIISQMPRMHLQNLVTGQWLHRDVQGVVSPSITWQLNAADQFSCQVGPPRPDLLGADGNPIFRIWQTATYLEENDEIKFGGILTSVSGNGPLLQLGFTGFAGYANGIIYEGPVYKKTAVDALDVVRDLWDWVQDQPGGNIGLVLDSTKANSLLGAYSQPGASTTMTRATPAGTTSLPVKSNANFQAQMKISIAGGAAHTVKSISGTNVIVITTPTANPHRADDTVVQVVAPTPFEIDWWNSTDIGGEIANIATEAIFDWYERHTWQDPAVKAVVKHALHFGVPRVGSHRQDLRFAEGENIITPATVNYDGSTFANNVIGLGAGQGSAQIRASVGITDQRLRRVTTYTDQTVTNKARMQSKAQKVLNSVEPTEAVSQIQIINHPNAPFGHFGPGDDIPVLLASSWHSGTVWSRITQMQQDPTTNVMTLTLARSDSFTYMTQSGQAGTM